MLSQYRWLSKQQDNKESKFKKIEKHLNEDMKDDSSVSSEISVSSASRNERSSFNDDKGGLVMNMKFVNRLRRNSLLKDTLLGKILNMKSKHSINFIDQESMKAQIKSLPLINSEITEIMSSGGKSSLSEEWDKNNLYEQSPNEISESSPDMKTYKMERSLLQEKRDKQIIGQFLMVKKNKVNEPIHEEPEEENTGEVNFQGFQKLKSLERRCTPQAIKRSKLEESK